MALIAHYKLNDNAASATVLDATGNYNGTYKDSSGNVNTSTGSTANSRGVGTCLDFDGTDEYVEVADNAIFTPALTAFSISAWVYMDDASAFWIVSKGVYNTDGEFRFGLESDDKLGCILMDESVDDCFIGRKYNTALTSHQSSWAHTAFTYDGGTSATGIKIYFNGLRVDDTDKSTSAVSFVSVENLAHAVWIGRYDTGYSNGLIDNVMIFNHVLHEDSIKALYNGGHGTEIVAAIDKDRRIKRR